MSFASLLGAIARRWHIVALGLLLTGGLAFWAASVAPPQYAARGLVMVMPPTSEDQGINPFLNLGGLDIPADVVATYFTSDPAQREIQDKYPGSSVTVSTDDSTRGPVIAIDVLDQTPRSTIDVLNFVADQIPTVLSRLQTQVGVGGNKALTSMPLTVDNEAKADYHSFTRMVIAASVAGLAATAVITFGIDGLLLRRRSIRDSKPRPEELDDDPSQSEHNSSEEDAELSVTPTPEEAMSPEHVDRVRELSTLHDARRDPSLLPRRMA